MLKIIIGGAILAGFAFGAVRLITWDLTTTCAARWQGVGETHWSRNAQCRVKINGVFVPEDNLIFNLNDAQ